MPIELPGMDLTDIFLPFAALGLDDVVRDSRAERVDFHDSDVGNNKGDERTQITEGACQLDKVITILAERPAPVPGCQVGSVSPIVLPIARRIE